MKTKKVESINGVAFRFTKIPAIAARDLLSELGSELDVLRQYIEISTDDGWVVLDSPAAIVKHITDWELLTLIELFSYDYNFGFLSSWEPTPLPAKMRDSNYRVAESKNVDAAVSALVTSGMAEYEQLRDVYSLEESFKLLDILTVKKINEFRAAEASK